MVVFKYSDKGGSSLKRAALGSGRENIIVRQTMGERGLELGGLQNTLQRRPRRSSLKGQITIQHAEEDQTIGS
jgi:hypothetical protein